MATSREERMQQRMRGALRHQVQDVSFDLFLPQEEVLEDATTAAPVEADAPSQASSPNAIRETPNASSTSQRRLQSSQDHAIPARSPRSTTRLQSATRSPAARRSGSARPATAATTTTTTTTSLRATQNEEEIGESPMDAPGSGQRRSVAVSAAARRTAALHEIVSSGATGAVSPTPGPRRRQGSSSSSSRVQRQQADKEVPSSSSPPPRTSRRRVSRSSQEQHEPPPTASARSRRSPRLFSGAVDVIDELSPELTAEAAATRSPGRQQQKSGSGDGDGGGSGVDGGMYSRLAHAKRTEALRRLSAEEAPDELSSPSFVGIDPGELTTTSVVPSSSPLARKSTVGARSARTSSNNPRRSTLSSLSSRSSRGSQVLGAAATAATATPVVPAATAGGDDDADEERDELSPEQPSSAQPLVQTSASSSSKKRKRIAEVPSSSPPLAPSSQNARSQRRRRQQQRQMASRSVEIVPEEEEEDNDDGDDDLAEEIDAAEAARTIGRKRPRRSTVHEPSPELGSDLKTAEPATVAAAAAAAAPSPAVEKQQPSVTTSKRRRRQGGLSEQSPSTQNQPRPPRTRSSKPAPAASAPTPTKVSKPAQKKKKQQQQQQQRKSKKAAEPEAADADSNDEATGRRSRGRASGPPVPITVQRFTRSRVSRGHDDDNNGDDDGAADPAAGDGRIPFADRSGVNSVDVLAQICEDIVEQSLQKVHDAAAAAAEEGTANSRASRETRKDLMARRRALVAFQDELRTRLLEQAVALDALHALRKRVRAAHKEKLALREEILRIRAERDQVALRMDALRVHHQAEKEKQMHHAALSATMHDIDLAVEQGRAAPPLTAAQKRTADLGNLELMVSRIAEQLCGSGDGGGQQELAQKQRHAYGNGTLKQIMDFNAFLERTAAVLEGRDRRPAVA